MAPETRKPEQAKVNATTAVERREEPATAVGTPEDATRLWKISTTVYRRQEKNAKILDFMCLELSRNFEWAVPEASV